MKSSTIRRSTLSRESMDVIESLANEQQNDCSSLGEYYRPDDTIQSQESSFSNKSKEIDMLWQTFKTNQFTTNSPLSTLFVGFVAGVLSTVIVFAMFGMFTKSPKVSTGDNMEQSIITQTEDDQADMNNRVSVPGENDFAPSAESSNVSESAPVANLSDTSSMTKYVVKNGDTGEAIIIKHYGSWTQERMDNIIKANNLKNLDRLQIDQVLYLP